MYNVYLRMAFGSYLVATFDTKDQAEEYRTQSKNGHSMSVRLA